MAVENEHRLSTGSTLLNLALADDPMGSLAQGHYYFFVGDSAAGKTMLVMTCLAEASQAPAFRRYRLIYDNVEDGCLMNLEALFGARMAKRVSPPAIDEDGAPVYSSTVEEFYYAVDDAVRMGRPFIYVLDSMDALTSEPADDKFEEEKKAHRKGKSVAGSYGDAKAKINSQQLRKVLKGVRDTNSILIILAQTRDSFGFGYETRTRAGGRALRFYSTCEVWTKIVSKLRRVVKGKERDIGVRVALEVKKNRITGKLAMVEVDIYPSYGIDDLGSLVDYLVEEGLWQGKRDEDEKKRRGKQAKGTITASIPRSDGDALELSGTRDKVLKEIEDLGLVNDVRMLAGQCWANVQDECALKRRKRYDETVGTD